MKKRSPRMLLLLIQAVLTMMVAASVHAQSKDNRVERRTPSIKLDHFWSYIVSTATSQPPVTATLKDQFQTVTVAVGSPLQFLNPAQKTIDSVITPIVDLNDHLTMYNLQNAAPLPASQTLTATNHVRSFRDGLFEKIL